MSEHEQLVIPGLSTRERLEALKPDEIVDHILELGERGTQIEKQMDEAAAVLEGAYGLTVEDILQQREERQNGEKT